MSRGPSLNEVWRERQKALRAAQEESSAGHARHGYDPNQPRVPAGRSDGGQWTEAGGSDPRVLSDATPDNVWVPGAQYANARGPRFGPVTINGRPVQVSYEQGPRLTEAQARAYHAISRVHEIDPSWQPRPSAFHSVEGLIRTYVGEAREAEARIAELARVGIGPGPYANESIPARGPGRNFTNPERREGNRMFFEAG